MRMPETAELYSTPNKMLMVGRVSIIIEFYQKLSPSQQQKRFIIFDGKRYKGKAVERLKRMLAGVRSK